MILVSVDRNRQLQSHRNQAHAEAVLRSAVSRSTARTIAQGEKCVRNLSKTYSLHDADGVVTGTRRERACMITVFRIEFLDAEDVTLDGVKACGFKTVQGFREAWKVRHPRTPEIALVHFVLGDWRDRDSFLNWTGRAGGDFTMNRHRSIDPDAPVLTREEIEALSSAARLRDDARRAKASQALAAETPSQRLLRLQAVVNGMGTEAARAIRQELRIIEQRVTRAERKEKAS